MTKKDIEFYKRMYEETETLLLQYASLRKNFSIMTDKILGDGYYNMGNDVYQCDKETCKAITAIATKANRTITQHIIDTINNK